MDKVNGKNHGTGDAPEVVRFHTVVEQVAKTTSDHCQRLSDNAMANAADRVVRKRRENAAKLRQLVDFLEDTEDGEEDPSIEVEVESEVEVEAVLLPELKVAASR